MDILPTFFPFQRRHDELSAQMAEPSFYQNPRRAAELTRAHQKLGLLLEDHRAFQKTGLDLADHAALARDLSAAPELRELALQELPALQRRSDELKRAILLAMLPPEPADSRNTVLEIRAGAGGDEASLFAPNSTACMCAMPRHTAGRCSP